MSKKSIYVILVLVVLTATGSFAAHHGNLFTTPLPIALINPCDRTLYPPDIAPPTFEWQDRYSGARHWKLTISFPDGKHETVYTSVTDWTPAPDRWEDFKRRTAEQWATVTVEGLKRRNPGLMAFNNTISRQQFTFATSADSVGAPIFYRDVPLPFDFATEKLELIQWRLGDISKSETPPLLLTDLPVCANCHTFTQDGSTLSMDLDFASDKGAFIITDVEKQMFLNREDTISWRDYKPDDQPTFGLLAQISPDGRYVAASVKDRVVFLPRQDLMFSQLFFPVKGIIVIYDRQTGEMFSLPGADDPDFVQGNPSWSPDGKYLMFVRHPVTEYIKNHYSSSAVLSDTESAIVLGGMQYLEKSEGGEKFMFDLYRVPFNDGKGGQAEPVPGMSKNGMSNFFPRFSPDGKWIVFCQAQSFMLLQPDSKLYIMPADFSAPPRELINTPRMNSWHSWSPNSRWLVFSSKLHGPYTDLFLKHIDENGNDSPPVLLSQFRSPNRARNIPEFVNIAQEGIGQIAESFVDYYSYSRKGEMMLYGGKWEEAERAYLKALELNPEYGDAHRSYGYLLTLLGRGDEAPEYYRKALDIDPSDNRARYLLGTYYLSKDMGADAERWFNDAIANDPDFAASYTALGKIDLQDGDVANAERLFQTAVEHDPNYLEAWFLLGNIHVSREEFDEAVQCYETVIRSDDDIESYVRLGQIYMMREQLDQAQDVFETAHKFDPANTGVLHSLGALYMERGDQNSAEKMFLDAYQSDPSDADALYNLSLIYLNNNRPAQAEQSLRAAIGINSDDPGAHLMLARLLSQAPAGRQECFRLYQRAALLAHDPAIFIECGNFCLQANSPENAIAAFQQALALDPSNTELRAHIEQLQGRR